MTSVGRDVWAFIGTQFSKAVEVSSPQALEGNNQRLTRIKLEDGEIRNVHASDVYERSANGQNQDDCCSLEKLNTATVLMNVENRYLDDQIYTYTSTVLLAINPYKTLPMLYTEEKRQAYKKIGSLQSKPPHPYALAERAYRCLRKKKKNQVIIVSGESGAGKTETAKIMMQYFADRSRTGKDQADNIQNKLILGANPVLESFGNAATVRNGNSSRFGKYNKLIFNPVGSLVGSEVLSFLLESNRAVHHDEGERSYHVYYELLAGAPPELLKRLSLEKDGIYKLLHKSGNRLGSHRADKANYKLLTDGLLLVGFNENLQAQLFADLAAFIHLGEVEIVAHNGDDEIPVIINEDKFAIAGRLLLIDGEDLKASILNRHYTVRQESWVAARSASEAQDALHSLLKTLYHRLFNLVVKVMNQSLAAAVLHTDTANSHIAYSNIGILDIYGFETLETNSFEQYCINFANERLQSFFIENVLVAEEAVYAAEGLRWDPFNEDPNIELLADLVRITSILDEACKLQQSPTQKHDRKFTSILHRSFGEREQSHFFEPPRGRRVIKPLDKEEGFTIKHYAGKVTYETSGWLTKNNGRLHSAVERVFASSHQSFVRELANVETNENGLSFKSVSTEFVSGLAELIANLNECKCSFVRCFKPNDEQRPGMFDQKNMSSQLVQSGTISLANLMHRGFPHRVSFDDIREKVVSGLPPAMQNEDTRMIIIALMRVLEVPTSEYQIGLSRVFFKNGRLEEVQNIIEEFNEDGEMTEVESANIAKKKAMLKDLQTYIRWAKLKRCLLVVKISIWLPKHMKRMALDRFEVKLARTAWIVVMCRRCVERTRRRMREARLASLFARFQKATRFIIQLNRWKKTACKGQAKTRAIEMIGETLSKNLQRSFFIRCKRARADQLWLPSFRLALLKVHCRRFVEKMRRRIQARELAENQQRLIQDVDTLRRTEEQNRIMAQEEVHEAQEKVQNMAHQVEEMHAEIMRLRQQADAVPGLVEEKLKLERELELGSVRQENALRLKVDCRRFVEKMRRSIQAGELAQHRLNQELQEEVHEAQEKNQNMAHQVEEMQAENMRLRQAVAGLMEEKLKLERELELELGRVWEENRIRERYAEINAENKQQVSQHDGRKSALRRNQRRKYGELELGARVRNAENKHLRRMLSESRGGAQSCPPEPKTKQYTEVKTKLDTGRTRNKENEGLNQMFEVNDPPRDPRGVRGAKIAKARAQVASSAPTGSVRSIERDVGPGIRQERASYPRKVPGAINTSNRANLSHAKAVPRTPPRRTPVAYDRAGMSPISRSPITVSPAQSLKTPTNARGGLVKIIDGEDEEFPQSQMRAPRVQPPTLNFKSRYDKKSPPMKR